MSLKVKFYLLCSLLHGLLLIGAYYVTQDNALIFLIYEGVLLCSLVIFLWLIKQALAPIEQIELFKDILTEHEYTARFPQSGSGELTSLVTLFNQMLKHLYQERLKLGDRKGMLQQLMDALPSAIVVFDYEGKISQLNPGAEKLLDVKGEDICGLELAAVKHPIKDKLQALPVGQSKMLTGSNGKRYRAQRNRFRDRGFDREFLLLQELTDELKSSEKNTYEKLIRLMSHEVNNTMAATSSLLRSCLYYADQIDPQEREDYTDAMTLVIARTEALSQFMQDFANMVRLPEPSLELCNLQHMLMSIKRLFEVQMSERNIELLLPDIDPEAAQVQCDRNQMEQVLINVVKNAMEAIGSNGKIDIDLYPSKGHLTLKVNDTGEGLCDSSQQDLFTPFFTTKAQGQGLGLMLVRDILDAHGFAFALSNRAGGGACFSIVFNLNAEQKPVAVVQ